LQGSIVSLTRSLLNTVIVVNQVGPNYESPPQEKVSLTKYVTIPQANIIEFSFETISTTAYLGVLRAVQHGISTML